MTKLPRYDKRANVDQATLTIENVIREISSPAVVNTEFIARVKAMTAEAHMACSVSAGIHTPDGKLTEAYR
jgi:hypothetical protein